MKPLPTTRLSGLPPYLFVKLNALKRKAEAAGLKTIDLGQGSPDLPSPPHVVKALQESVQEPWTHRYPQPPHGSPEYRQAIAAWYRRRFSVDLDSETEVLPLIGSKEGLGHLFLAFLNPGDGVLVPDPCYPVHHNGVLLAGGKVHRIPLREESAFLPDLSGIPPAAAKGSKFLILNYPNNPTGATLPGKTLLEEALAFAKKYDLLVIYDNAYSELTFDGYKAPSILQIPKAKERALEFHSLSKTYSMAGWRLGFAVGNADALAGLSKFKGFLDYGIPAFLQKAAIAALSGPQECIVGACGEYQKRRDVLARALEEIGWQCPRPKAAMYLWTRLPRGAAKLGSLAFAERLILEQGVVISPGVGFGPGGEGYVRFSLIEPAAKLEEAARRIGKFLKAAALTVLLLAAGLPARAARPLTPPAPEFPKEAPWINAQPMSLSWLRGRRVVVVAFLNFYNINSIRTLDSLNRWWDKYSLHGLMIVGVHTPDYDFDHDPRVVRQVLQHLGVRFPVVMDKTRILSRAYSSEVWPARFLIDQEGRIIYDRLGEGGSEEFEREILEAMYQFIGYSLPRSYHIPKDPDRRDCGQVTGPVYLGVRRGKSVKSVDTDRAPILSRALNGEVFALGPWSPESDSMRFTGAGGEDLGAQLQLFYQGAEAHAVMARLGSRPVRVYFKQDGLWIERENAAKDIQWDSEGRSYVLVDIPRLYYLVKNKEDNMHELVLFPSEKGLKVSGFEFSDRCQTDYVHP